ncbi:hypothetical protein DFH09DRAFT_1270578 [Mycena vulgaris]|nr:hypothetical protein DFH09DRAFT_1270578 [Mycena vulgaris]
MCESEQLANTVIFNWVNFNSTYYFVDTSIRATGPTSGIKPRNFNHPEGSEARESVVNADENVSKAAWLTTLAVEGRVLNGSGARGPVAQHLMYRRPPEDVRLKLSIRCRRFHPSKSNAPSPPVPATPAAPTSKKATNAKDRFSATILAEEETAQQALNLKRDKNKYQKEVIIAKLKMESEVRAARVETKRQDRAAKMDLVRLKMEQDHQFRMAQFQSQQGAAGPSSFSSSSSHHDGSPFPSLFDELTLPTQSAGGSPGPSSYGGFGGFPDQSYS